jgi:AcrR family transcriptional regulator
MKKITKGELTHKFIVIEARKVFNENGIELTLKELSEKMGVTIGKITNHFSTKDHLFAGLSKMYQEEYQTLSSSYSWNNEYTLSKLFDYIGCIMDLQYKHRCLLLYVNATGVNQKVMIKQISATWRENLTGFEQLLSLFVKMDVLKKEVLQPDCFPVVKFQFINLFTTWLVSFTIYDNGKSYKKMMVVYKKGIIYCLYPYLTPKGHLQLSNIN